MVGIDANASLLGRMADITGEHVMMVEEKRVPKQMQAQALAMWAADHGPVSYYVALMNAAPLGSKPKWMEISFDKLGVKNANVCGVIDCWTKKEVPDAMDEIAVLISPGSSLLFYLGDCF